MTQSTFSQLASMYTLVLDREDLYRHQLDEFIQSAFRNIGDDAIHLLPEGFDTWEEADKAGEFDAMADLPSYLLLDDGDSCYTEYYITSVYRDDHTFYIDGYDYKHGQFFTNHPVPSDLENFTAIAQFIHAVLEQIEQLMNDEAEPIPEPTTDIARAVAYVRQNVDMREVCHAHLQMMVQCEPLFRVNYRLCNTIYDLMEEYGADNGLSEGWWLDKDDEETVLIKLM